jgi:exonuclease SbcD
MEDSKIRLDFFVDPRSGAKIVGISARKVGLESKYYELLDKEYLENEVGFKIFMFHSGLDEFKPKWLSNMESVPVSYFPKGFDYYAGGHVHEKGEFRLPGYERVVFPGPLFTGYGKDLEISAKGAKRGFYVVNFDDKVEKVEFVEVKSFESTYFEYDVTGKNAIEADRDLQERLEALDVTDKIVILKVIGELSGGKTSNINFTKIKAGLTGRKALYVYLNRYRLTTKEYSTVRVAGEDISTIENRLFKENIGAIRVSSEYLKDEKGTQAAVELLNVFRQAAKSNESKKEYLERMKKNGLEVLRLKEMFEVETQ